MKYLKYFEGFISGIKVRVDKLINQEYSYRLHIDGKTFLYNTFPFVKGQDNFEILSETPTGYEIEIDKNTFDKNKAAVNRDYSNPKNIGNMKSPFEK